LFQGWGGVRAGACAWGAAGRRAGARRAWARRVTAYRPKGAGIAGINGWRGPGGGYGVGAAAWAGAAMLDGQVTDADIQPNTAFYETKTGSTSERDMYNGTPGDMNILNGINAAPRYASGNGPGASGMYQLAAGSPGYDQGVRIPNFNDGFSGSAPDVGAHEAGSAAMKFGLAASSGPAIAAGSRPACAQAAMAASAFSTLWRPGRFSDTCSGAAACGRSTSNSECGPSRTTLTARMSAPSSKP